MLRKSSYISYGGWALRGVGLLAALVVVGFFIFATFVTRSIQNVPAQADGIVVFTGESERIVVAARLLTEGRAKRLLISGVNKNTSKADVLRLSKLNADLFACCVTLGYAAQDTKGNAMETLAWQRRNSFKSLILVTSFYHMPRSLMELYSHMPNVILVPHSVSSKKLRDDYWWQSSYSARLLAYEYAKFLPSTIQFVWSRIFVSQPKDVDGITPIHSHHAGARS